MPSRVLSDAVVVVLGASGGLGRPVAELLAARGARLVLAGRDAARLPDIDGAARVTADVRDAAAGDLVVGAARDRYGRLDGVVNCAGVVAFGPLLETDDAVVEELFATNVIGPLLLARRVAPALAESRGFLVNVSAVVAEQPMAGLAAYSASKAALTAADRALARELRRLGIQVCDVRPPHTETGLASRPLAGIAPRLGPGLDPVAVAGRIVTAIEAGETEVPASAFSGEAA